MCGVVREFEGIARGIQSLAESVLEKEISGGSSASASSRPSTAAPSTSTSTAAGTPSTPPPLFSSSMPLPPNSFTSTGGQHHRVSSTSSSPITKNITPVSSFLSAKKVDPDGYPRTSREIMRARPLSEIVGRENIFGELHASFSSILSRLVRELER